MISQGVVKLWIEINKAKASPEEEAKLYDISLEPREEYEIRLCIF